MRGFEVKNGRLIWTGYDEVVWMEPYGPNVIRVRASRSLRIAEQDWTLLPPLESEAKITVSEQEAAIENGKKKVWGGPLQVAVINEDGTFGEFREVEVVG